MLQFSEGWEKKKVALGWIVGVIILGYGVYSYAEGTYLKIADFKQAMSQTEMRILMKQKQQLETDILRLTVKRNIYPTQFDAVDRTILEKQAKQLEETQEEIKQLQRKNGRNGN